MPHQDDPLAPFEPEGIGNDPLAEFEHPPEDDEDEGFFDKVGRFGRKIAEFLQPSGDELDPSIGEGIEKAAGQARGLVEGAGRAPLGLASGAAGLVGAEGAEESLAEMSPTGFLPDAFPEPDPIMQGVGRMGGEMGLLLSGGGAVGAGLRGLGKIGQLGRAGQVASKLGSGGGLAGDIARFAPVDALFGASEETSGAAALSELTGVGDLSGDENRAKRMAAELALGGGAAGLAHGLMRGLGVGGREAAGEAAEQAARGPVRGIDPEQPAAIRVGDRQFTAGTHADAAALAERELGEGATRGPDADLEIGFQTDQGGFVGFEDAADLGRRSGQLQEGDQLDSFEFFGNEPDPLRPGEVRDPHVVVDKVLRETDQPVPRLAEEVDPYNGMTRDQVESFDPAGETAQRELGGGENDLPGIEGAKGGFFGDQRGFMDPDYINAITREAMTGGAGGLIGAGLAGEDDRMEGFLLGGAAAIGSVHAIKHGGRIIRESQMAEDLRRVIRSPDEESAEAMFRNIQEYEDALDDATLKGQVGDEVMDPTTRGTIRHTPKEIDIDKIEARIGERLDHYSSYDRDMIGDIIRRMADDGDIKQVRITNEQTRKAASQAGFDMSDLNVPAGQMGRVKQFAALQQLQRHSEEYVKLQDIMARSQGRVSDEEWERLMALSDMIEDDIEKISARVLKEGSEFGRALQSQKMRVLSNATFDPDNSSVWILQARKKAGGELGTDDIARIRHLLAEGDRKGMMDLMQEMEFRGASLGEKAATFVKAGLLSAPKTDMLNVGSTLSWMGLRRMRNPVAAVTDRLLSLATNQRSVANIAHPTGGLVKLTDEGIKIGDGLKRGLEAGTQIWKEGLGGEGLIKYDFRGMKSGNPIADAYLKWGFRRLGAEDAVMKGMAYHSAKEDLARVWAMNSGLEKGTPAFKQEVQRLIADSPDEMEQMAAMITEEATFTNINKVSQAVNAWKQGMKEAGNFAAAASELTIPFVNTLINVGDAVLKMSPLGVLRPPTAKKLVQFTSKMLQGKGHEIGVQAQREIAEALAGGLVGSGLMFAGFKLREAGAMTAGWPDGPRGNVFMQANLQPFSLVLGDNTVSVENISPAGNVLALGAQMYDIVNDPEYDGATDFAAGAYSAYAHQMSELTFLANTQTALQAIAQPERSEPFLENLGRMMVPTLVRQGSNALDPTRRRTDGFFSAIQASTPASGLMEPQIGPLGEERVRNPGNLPEAIGNPFARKVIDKRPIIRELTSLGVGVPRLTTPSRRDLEGGNRTKVEHFYGQQLQKHLENIMSNPRYARMPDEMKKEVLSREIRSKRSEVSRTLTDMGILPETESVQLEDPAFRGLGGTVTERDPLAEFEQ